MADQQQPIHHSRPQGRGVRASLALAGLLTLTVPLVLAGVTCLGAVPALAAPYTLTGTAGQAGSAGGAAGTDALNPVPPALPQADLSADSLTLSGGAGGAGRNSITTAGGQGGSAGLTVSNDLTSTTNAGDSFTAGIGGQGGAGMPGVIPTPPTGGAGGVGGKVFIDVGNDFSSAGAATFTAGSGGVGGGGGSGDASGTGGTGGVGGAGGAVSVDVGNDFSSAGAATFTAGDGGLGGGGGGRNMGNSGGDGSVGGAGGSVTVHVGNNFSSTGAAVFSAGNGGTGGSGNFGNNGGDGGAGGNLTVDVDGKFSSTGAATFTAGNGGSGDLNSTGGAGGDLSLNLGRGLDAQGLLSLTAGQGGVGVNVNNSPGGNGGSASLNAPAADLSLPGGFNIAAGNGGNGGAGDDAPGGDGGAATLTAKNLTFTGTGSLTSGNNGGQVMPISPGGAGGAAGLTVSGIMTAYGDTEMTMFKGHGALLFSANTLLLNAETSAGATANARFQLLRAVGGQELSSDSIAINTLILAGDADAAGHAAVFSAGGGLRWASDPLQPAPGNPDEFYIPHIAVRGTGNVLNVQGFTGQSLSGGRGLQDLTFQITGREVGQGHMLGVSSGQVFDLAGLAGKLSIQPLNALNLTKGEDKITFIRNLHNNAPIVDSSGAFSATTAKRYSGTFGLTEYNFDLFLNGQDLVGTYAGLTPPPVPPVPDPGKNYKPYFEGLLGELATLNNSGNAIARTVGQAAALPRGDDWRLLVNAEAQHVRIDTGSHLDNDSLALTLALARQLENRLGALTLGAFFETGWGDHSTYNNLERFGGVDGNGDTNFYGGGLFARQDFNCGFYAEASGRVGIVDYNFDVDDRRFDNASYDDSETYWGAHAGLGYLWRFSERNVLEAYDKLFWTHVDSGETSTDANENIRYDAMDSLRNRLGARLHHEFTDQVSAYLGAAWEYEFDGAADGSVRVAGESLSLSDSPDMRGSTGVGELGLAAQPAASVPLYIDLSVYGLVGTQEGVGGAVQFKYTF